MYGIVGVLDNLFVDHVLDANRAQVDAGLDDAGYYLRRTYFIFPRRAEEIQISKKAIENICPMDVTCPQDTVFGVPHYGWKHGPRERRSGTFYLLRPSRQLDVFDPTDVMRLLEAA